MLQQEQYYTVQLPRRAINGKKDIKASFTRNFGAFYTPRTYISLKPFNDTSSDGYICSIDEESAGLNKRGENGV